MKNWLRTIQFMVFLVFSASFLETAVSQRNVAKKGDAKKGKAKTITCQACHGIAGVSNNDLWPNLAGQKQDYLIKAIKDYKSGARKEPLMTAQAKLIKDEDIEDITAYFSTLRLKIPKED